MSSFQSSIVYSVILAVVGFGIMSLANNLGMTPPVAFAAGLFIGPLLISLITNRSASATTPSTTSSSTPAATPTSAAPSKDDNAEQPSGPTKTIYVGNLPYRANEAIIKELFEKYGYVHSVRLLKDRQTGKRRGFGFVEMAESAALTAIAELNESEFQQRTLKVREAKDRPEKDENEEFQQQA
ncbi:MAG: RNA recognition motif-containing protein [Phenylobacterium sp.]|jgi:RNA recognition motif-containing protein